VSDCGPGCHSADVWQPAARCTDCGHRVAAPWGSVPVATRRLPWRYWVFEIFARWAARAQVREREVTPGGPS